MHGHLTNSTIVHTVEGNMDSKATRIHLIASDDDEPRVRLRAGKHYDVLATSVVDHDFNEIAEEVREPGQRPARLCGGRSTCVAIVETGDVSVS